MRVIIIIIVAIISLNIITSIWNKDFKIKFLGFIFHNLIQLHVINVFIGFYFILNCTC